MTNGWGGKPPLSGERQVSPTLEGIRADHINRYKWALGKLPRGSVIDAACGVGYGSWILANSGRYVRAIEKDPGAVEYAKKHYSHKNIYHQCADLRDIYLSGDPVVAFEFIEHIKDPLPILKKFTGLLLASVPNETIFPYKNYKFHYRHYTKIEFEELLNQAGYKIHEWYGQGIEIKKNAEDRTLITVATKCV